MVHFYDSVPENLQEWILQQSVFFTATAPIKGEHVNLSPKGLAADTFHLYDGNHAAYIDATGSGVETISHVYDNGRVTLMFCSLEQKPRIMRLFCKGHVIERKDPRFESEMKRINKNGIPGTRAIIMLDIWKAQTSCGYGVPLRDEQAHAKHAGSAVGECSCYSDRPTLGKALAQMEKKESLDDYIKKMSARSLDGLRGLKEARKMNGEILLAGDAKAWMDYHINHPMAIFMGILLGILLALYGPIIQEALMKTLIRSQGRGSSAEWAVFSSSFVQHVADL